MQAANQAAAQMPEQTNGGSQGLPPSDIVTEEDVLNGLDPETREMYDSIPEQARATLLKNAMAQGGIS